MIRDVIGHKAGEAAILSTQFVKRFIGVLRHRATLRLGEVALGRIDRCLVECLRAIFQVRPLFINPAAELFDAQCFDENLDPRLELVVTTAELVVNPHTSFQIGQQVLPGQVFTYHVRNHWRAAKPTTGQNFNAQLAISIAP